MANTTITGINWRDTARPVRFFFLDARVLCGMLVWAFHMCMETFVLAICSIVIFAIIEFFGLTPGAALRTIKTWILGSERLTENYYFQRRRAQW